MIWGRPMDDLSLNTFESLDQANNVGTYLQALEAFDAIEQSAGTEGDGRAVRDRRLFSLFGPRLRTTPGLRNTRREARRGRSARKEING